VTINSQFLLTSLLVTLESLQQGPAIQLCLPQRSTSLPDSIHIFDDVKTAMTSSMTELSGSVNGGLVHFDPGILQQLTNPGGVSMFTLKPGSCLINSANSFASPSRTAAASITFLNGRRRSSRNQVNSKSKRRLPRQPQPGRRTHQP